MTILVCVNTCYPFISIKGKPISFEPGIVMAGDTRLTVDRTQPILQDNYLKIDWLTKNVGAGFSGYVDIAETAIIRAAKELGLVEYVKPLQAAQLIKEELMKLANSFPIDQVQKTDVILGGYDKELDTPNLMILRGISSFRIELIKGLTAIGSGTVKWRTGVRLARRIGNSHGNLRDKLSQGPCISIDDTASFIFTTIEKEIETARQLGALTTIGGYTSVLVISARTSYMVNR